MVMMMIAEFVMEGLKPDGPFWSLTGIYTKAMKNLDIEIHFDPHPFDLTVCNKSLGLSCARPA